MDKIKMAEHLAESLKQRRKGTMTDFAAAQRYLRAANLLYEGIQESPGQERKYKTALDYLDFAGKLGKQNKSIINEIQEMRDKISTGAREEEPKKESSKTHSAISQIYENLGKESLKAGNLQKAIENYRSAEKTAAYDDRGRIRNIISYLSRHEKRRNIEGKIMGTISISALLGALFFSSLNITGNAIGNLNYGNISVIGTALFILGLVFAFLFVRNKRK